MVKSVETSIDGGLGQVKSRLKELVAIKERQSNRELTNGDIAVATGISEHTIGKWMKPRPLTQINADVVRRLCKYLECQIGELLYIERSDN